MNVTRILCAALLAAGSTLVGADCSAVQSHSHTIGGPYARLLESAADLGPSRAGHVQLTAALRHAVAPVRLQGWAQRKGLSVQWREGEDWATVDGPSERVAAAFGVAVHDYRVGHGGQEGRVFQASPQQPATPSVARAEVAGLGRILGYLPFREAMPPNVPRDVPDGGLLPKQLLNAYNATPLADAGYTGAGTTVAVFGFDGFNQQDLDDFAEWFGLPAFTPEVVGGMPAHRSGEVNMDLQVIHAIAPGAKLVLVNARPSVEEGGGFVKLGELMSSVERQFPGAIWSLSIGWGCDRLFTQADLAPVRTALAKAVKRGTTAFDATGDLAGLECKGGHDWSDPPSPDDVGVDAVASIPEMTSVGGTRLSTDAEGRWLAEQSWYNVPLTQGTAGGPSGLYPRPPWQTIDPGVGSPGARLVPDVSAVADPFTGVKHVFNRQVIVGGGTSQAAPIWAGLAALINEMFAAGGSKPLGEINPVLYQIAAGSGLPSFHDVRLGGNAIMRGGLPGYDMVTGLGTPNVENLARNILLVRSARR